MVDQKTEHLKETKSFGKLAAWVSFLSIELIIIGALVRATDSGLACPDWPLCYGKLIPAMDMQIFIEWFHRFMALILAGLIVAMIVKLLRNTFLRKTFRLQLWAAFLLFVNQCILGGLTVLKLLDPKIVSLHLINALFFLSLMIWIAIRARIAQLPDEKLARVSVGNGAVKWILIVGIFAVLGQIFLGGMVAANHAGLVCPDFPTCFGKWFPKGSFLVFLQMAHRYVGIALVFYLVIAPALCKKETLSPWSVAAITWTPLLALAQLALGIIAIFNDLPIWASVAHQGNAVIIVSLYFTGFIESYELSLKQKLTRVADKSLGNIVTLPSAIREVKP